MTGGAAWHRRLRSDRGSSTVELALVAPGLLLLFGLVVLGGRIALAGGSIEQVAAAAARQASLARDGLQARSVATETARQSLAAQHLQCAAIQVRVDTSGFRLPLGQPASVVVDVDCAARLSDVAIPGLPGTRALHAHAVSPLDSWRGKSLGFGDSDSWPGRTG